MNKHTKTVVVRPEPITELGNLKLQSLPPAVSVEIDDSVPDKYLADAALDVFHRSFPLAALEYLEIAVFHQEKEIFPAAEFEDGEFEEFGKVA